MSHTKATVCWCLLLRANTATEAGEALSHPGEAFFTPGLFA